MKIIEAIKAFYRWVRHWIWDVPISKPERDKPARVLATEVTKEYMVIQYHGQRVNLHRLLEYPIWKTYSRNEKRATAKGFEKMEKEGKIRFEIIEGVLTCIKNKNYQAMAENKK